MKEFNVTINGTAYQVAIEEVEGCSGVATNNIKPVQTITPKHTPVASHVPPVKKVASTPKASAAGTTNVNAPMPGKIVKVIANPGQVVKKGEVLLILEAMKMQNEISAPIDGKVKTISVAAGQNVKPGEVLAIIE